jgi:transcriptional regulator with XRE-family HTH domain
MSVTEARQAARWRVPRVVRLYAKARRITDQSLADQLGLSRTAVRLRLSGQTRIADDELAALAVIFGVEPGDFFDERWDDVIGTAAQGDDVTTGNYLGFINLAEPMLAA